MISFICLMLTSDDFFINNQKKIQKKIALMIYYV
jgi:hypothetical protein